MRRAIILMVIYLFAKELSAQQSMTDCVKNIFINADSLNVSGKNPFEEWKVCVIDKPMPGFVATGISGDSIEMKKLQGKVVVINFWFIDCRPCIAELPAMNALAKEYKGKGVEFLAMTWETPKRIKEEFLVKYKLDFTIIPVSWSIINKIIASGYPTTFIIDELGIIRSAWNGGPTDAKAETEFYEKAKPVIDKLLNGG